MSKMDKYKKALKWNLQNGYVKVKVDTGCDEAPVEWLWCSPIDDNLLQVDNIPFFTDKVCMDDVIEVESLESEGYKDFCYKLIKVVEHVREGLYIQYNADDMEDDELKSRYATFAEGCREHDLKVEGAVRGCLVVAVPWGKAEESLPIIMEYAETAGLEMVMYDE